MERVLYMSARKFSGVSDYAHGYFARNFNGRFFGLML